MNKKLLLRLLVSSAAAVAFPVVAQKVLLRLTGTVVRDERGPR